MKCTVITSTRADFGLLRHPMSAIDAHPDMKLSVIASGTHLDKAYGYTRDEIKRAGFDIAADVPILSNDDDAVSVAHTLGRAVSGFADTLSRDQPDYVVLLGDRYEIFGAASAATLLRLPIVHLCGGDVTEGAYDEAFRHSISKMAALHFPTHKAAAQRLMRMGESQDRIFTIGNTGLDALSHMNWLSRETVFARLGINPRPKNVVVTYHPVTRDPVTALVELDALLTAFDHYTEDLGIVFTGVNADTGGSQIQSKIFDFANNRDHVVTHNSLGHSLYMNTVRQMDAVVGNSSSGIYEAPALKTATLDIGPRQKGRPQAESVIHVDGDSSAILNGLNQALSQDCSTVQSLYGSGGASEKLVEILARPYDRQALLSKPFIDTV